jgi:maleate cis-trans isomerase
VVIPLGFLTYFLPENIKKKHWIFQFLSNIGENFIKNANKSINTNLSLNFNFSSFSSSIVEVLRGFKPESFSSEQELEKQLAQYLRGQGFEVKRQVHIGERERIDLKVSDNFQDYYIEIKEINSKSAIDRAVGQIERYLRYLNPSNLIFLALITKNIDTKDLDLIRNKGVEVVEIQAFKKQNNRRKKEINISIKV